MQFLKNSISFLHRIVCILYRKTQVDSAFYLPWDGKISTSQRAVMLCGWEGNRTPGRK